MVRVRLRGYKINGRAEAPERPKIAPSDGAVLHLFRPCKTEYESPAMVGKILGWQSIIHGLRNLLLSQWSVQGAEQHNPSDTHRPPATLLVALYLIIRAFPPGAFLLRHYYTLSLSTPGAAHSPPQGLPPNNNSPPLSRKGPNTRQRRRTHDTSALHS